MLLLLITALTTTVPSIYWQDMKFQQVQGVLQDHPTQ